MSGDNLYPCDVSTRVDCRVYQNVSVNSRRPCKLRIYRSDDLLQESFRRFWRQPYSVAGRLISAKELESDVLALLNRLTVRNVEVAFPMLNVLFSHFDDRCSYPMIGKRMHAHDQMPICEVLDPASFANLG